MKVRIASLVVGALACLALSTAALAATSINAIDGGDPGDGGDFEGNFVYAVEVGGAGGQTVGDASFTDWTATAGAAIVAPQAEGGQDNDFGDSANDDALESVMATGQWANSGDGEVITADLDVTPGQAYKLQLLFVEGWNATAGARQFNVEIEGDLVAADFDISAVAGDQPVVDGEGTNTAGAVITHTYTAGDDSLNVLISQGAIDNPRLDGLTLEAIPEPATVALLATAGLAAAGYSLRRRMK